ncbi:MAG: tRNA (adenosine(37)-N6)-dimethylallyltransferase MiaA [Bacteroidales bacterium]|nr:tRNA (adenosine(37)-N6)-dimethylallyltransferase MiaA [Bacteroidales bacterium]
MNKFLVVIGGPTASGKTEVAIDLAKAYRSEIISADSRQIYKETSIGTAVPAKEQLNEVPHHFIQCISLNDYYNASMYETDVLRKLNILFKEHDIVIMAGGSGLYINAVCFGIDDLPAIDLEIRNNLFKKYEKEGIASLRTMLKDADPATYEKIDLNNHFRILKALEVTVQTGKPYSSFLTRKKKTRDFGIIRIGLNLDRAELYDRINKRTEKMIEKGLVEEVRSLVHLRKKNAMKTVGYREIFRYLDDEISLDEAVDLIKNNTRKYARKQITWFRKNNLYPWFNPEKPDSILRYIDDQLNKKI